MNKKSCEIISTARNVYAIAEQLAKKPGAEANKANTELKSRHSNQSIFRNKVSPSNPKY